MNRKLAHEEGGKGSNCLSPGAFAALSFSLFLPADESSELLDPMGWISKDDGQWLSQQVEATDAPRFYAAPPCLPSRGYPTSQHSHHVP